MIYFIFAVALFVVLVVGSIYIREAVLLFWPERNERRDLAYLYLPLTKDIFLAKFKATDERKEKPVVRWCNFGGCWECVSAHSVGYGSTMRDAWRQWRLWLPGAV